MNNFSCILHMRRKITIKFRYGTIWKRLNTSKETKSVLSKEEKKVIIVVQQSSLPQMELKMMEPIVYFLYLTWFFYFFHGLFQAKISEYDSLHFESKNIALLFVLFGGNLVFRLVTPFSASVSKNFTRFFLWDVGGRNGFSLKIAAVNFRSLQKFYDNGASGVLRRLTAVSAEIPAIIKKQRRLSRKYRPGWLQIIDYFLRF